MKTIVKNCTCEKQAIKFKKELNKFHGKPVEIICIPFTKKGNYTFQILN